MSLKTVFLLALIVVAPRVQAGQCELPTTRIDLVTGPLLVNSDLPAGSIVATRSWTIDIPAAADRCQGTKKLTAKWRSPLSVTAGNNVWQTGIPGIGMRISLRAITGQKLFWPGETHLSLLALKGAQVSLDLVKTSAATGSGAMASGEYASLTMQGQSNPVLRLNAPDNGIIVSAPSCSLPEGAQRHIRLPAASDTTFHAKGSYSTAVPFTLNLRCQGGLAPAGNPALHVTWFGQLARVREGVLKNLSRDGNAAQGIGIQVLDHQQKPLRFNRPQRIASIPAQAQIIPLRLSARYYQYEQHIRPGQIYAALMFNLDYF